MSEKISRRSFIKESVVTTATGALVVSASVNQARAQGPDNKPAGSKVAPGSKNTLPKGKIGGFDRLDQLFGISHHPAETERHLVP